MLTERQLFALRWLKLNRQSKLGWRQNGKAAYGNSDKWDAMKIEGADGSIIIPVADWEALRPFMKMAPQESNQAFIPNDAGESALSSTQGQK